MQLIEHRIGESLEAFFNREYVDGGRSQSDLATQLGVDVGSVSRWMARLGIGARRGRPRKSGQL